MTYQNDSFIAEHWHDQLHERSETVRDETETCPTCKGEGREYYSACCGAEVIDGICQDIDCLKPCETESEECGECKGEGEV